MWTTFPCSLVLFFFNVRVPSGSLAFSKSLLLVVVVVVVVVVAQCRCRATAHNAMTILYFVGENGSKRAYVRTNLTARSVSASLFPFDD